MDIEVLVGLVISGVAAVAAGILIAPTRRASRPARVAENVAQFKRYYDELRRRQTDLSQEVLVSSPASWKQGDVPMLAQPGWILERPVHLDSIDLILYQPPGSVDALVTKSRILAGLDLAGPITYSDAVIDIAGMQHFTDGVIYRPLAVDLGSGRLALSFEEGRYFDYLSTSEVLAYEKAAAHRRYSYREQLANPFDLTNRVASLGILTLTLIRGSAGATFFMHKRTAKVVLGSDLFHVLPAGEFTPSDISIEAVKEDLSLWRNIAREYAEELLGIEDAQGQGGRRIDYQNDSPYKELAEATSAGGLRIFVLGLGLDPLTYKPELLTVAIFTNAAFDAVFGNRVVGNYEGTVIEEIPYTEENVQSYVASKHTRLGAKACLQLSWRHRAVLGLE